MEGTYALLDYVSSEALNTLRLTQQEIAKIVRFTIEEPRIVTINDGPNHQMQPMTCKEVSVFISNSIYYR